MAPVQLVLPSGSVPHLSVASRARLIQNSEPRSVCQKFALMNTGNEFAVSLSVFIYAVDSQDGFAYVAK